MAYTIYVILSVAIAILICTVAWPVSQAAKNDAHRPLAAYLIFVSVFALTGAAIFGALLGLALATGLSEFLNAAPAIALVVLAVVAPAAAAALYAVRTPPRKRMPD